MEHGVLISHTEPVTSSPITALAISADGLFPVTAHEDGSVWLHAAEPVQLGNVRPGVAAAFSPAATGSR